MGGKSCAGSRPFSGSQTTALVRRSRVQALRLDGIDGQHLWGFLTALGTLALLDEGALGNSKEAPRLAFADDGTAVLYAPVGKDDLASVLFIQLQSLWPYVETGLEFVKRPGDFTRAIYEGVVQQTTSDRLDFLAGLACVVGEETSESTLCAANGASHQNLVQSMRDILKLVQVAHLHQSLFEPWKKAYRVPDDQRKRLGLGERKPTLRLDPADERLYALRFSNPTTADDFCTELGAQALAIPAFALLPVVPTKKPVTVASTRDRQRVTFSWGLWNTPATLRTVRSLVWEGVGQPRNQRARGVFAAFSADRVSGAKGKLSFAPSRGVW